MIVQRDFFSIESMALHSPWPEFSFMRIALRFHDDREMDSMSRLRHPNILMCMARHDSAEDFSRLDALLFTAMAWIFIPAYCFAIP